VGCDRGDDRVGPVGEQDAEHDVELDQADQASAGRRGRYLGGVDGGTYRCRAHTDAAEEPKDHEDRVIAGQGGS